MRRYKLTYEYDGTNFKGWQKQPDVRTVEGEAEKAFATLYQKEIDIIGQGRTDAGVHAQAQTAHVDLPDRFESGKIVHAMKGLLPDDVVLREIEVIKPTFHARFDAVSRSYRYQIVTHPVAMNRDYCWYTYHSLDKNILHQCAKKVIGKYDFENFCIPVDDKYLTTICTISHSKWQMNDHSLAYTIKGNRFLRHMVRRLVGCMVKAAAGKVSIDDFDELLNGGKKAEKAFSAPSKGLILQHVDYPIIE